MSLNAALFPVASEIKTGDVDAMTDAEQNQGDDADALLQQKHAAMLQRLAIKEDARLQKFAARRADSLASVNPSESKDRFLQSFSEQFNQAEKNICSLQQKVSSEEDKSSIKRDLDQNAIKVLELEQFLAENSYFLPAYEVRASQSSISSLRMKLEHINAELVSKKKFTFKSKIAKNKNTTESSTLQASEPSQVSDSDAGKVNDPPYSVIGAPDRSKSRDDSESSESLHSRSSCMIRDMENSTIVRDLKNQEDSEIILQNLINCSVYIRGVYRAMYAHNLRGCKVFSGPITGSSLIEEIEECTMMLASQQIRIHNAKMSDMYLRVRSRPIVEYTERVRFAPYAFTYSGIENDLSFANLHEETGLWEHVDDFRWLRAIPSPNWSVLPEEERIGLVDGSSLEL